MCIRCRESEEHFLWDLTSWLHPEQTRLFGNAFFENERSAPTGHALYCRITKTEFTFFLDGILGRGSKLLQTAGYTPTLLVLATKTSKLTTSLKSELHMFEFSRCAPARFTPHTAADPRSTVRKTVTFDFRRISKSEQ